MDFGNSTSVEHMIKNSIPSLKTRLFWNDQYLAVVTIKNRYLLERNSYSPLLLVINMVPFSVVLRKVNGHCELRKNGPHLNPLLFKTVLKNKF